jgi:signal transduction histidine kinase/CheY-like chemotaxis protein
MRVSSSLVAIALLVLLLTWLSWRAFDSEAERFDRAYGALDRVAAAESALNRDILRARAGILRNYDELVRDGKAVEEGLGQLRATAGTDPEAAAAVDRLAASLVRQAALVEQFKSDNALLQNSLAYFERFSAQLAVPERSGPVPAAVSALAAAMLRLSLDTSPESARDVGDRLGDLERVAAAAGDVEPQALLAHSRLLQRLLPDTDSVLKSLVALSDERDQAELRRIVLTQQKVSRATARRSRLLLYLASLALVALLIRLGLQLQWRARALRRRASFEHVVSGISMRFISTQLQSLDGDIDRALSELADCIGAERAYFLLSGPAGRKRAWCRQGMLLPPGWPDRAPALARSVTPTGEGLVHLADVDQLGPGPERDDCLAFGLRGWACAFGRGEDGRRILLGFDFVRQPSRIMEDGELGLLRMVRDTIANTVVRSVAEGERARLAAQLQQARRMETVGALASGIAHNFNNIIGAILGYAEMAEEQGPPGRHYGRSLAEIRRAGERARDLVDQILDFGRGRDARRRSVSIRDAVAEAASLLRASLPPVDIAFGEVPKAAVVRGVPVQLQQVIINLAKNGAQAMDRAGAVEIMAELRDLASSTPLSHGKLVPGRYVCLAVSDSGRGMSRPVMERIFEPFFTTRDAGNGLGLATVREIVREHGGAMNVWSAVGTGSRFEVWLPCEGTLATPVSDEARRVPLGRGETLLLVDRDRERLLGSEELLAALGYEPVGFVDAEEALRSCRQARHRYDAFVLGGLVSTRAALDLAAALRALAPELPLLLTTSSAEHVDPGVLMSAGVTEVIGRPLVAAELAGALQRCLARQYVPRPQPA